MIESLQLELLIQLLNLNLYTISLLWSSEARPYYVHTYFDRRLQMGKDALRQDL